MDPYDYDQNTFITAHHSGMVANIVENDIATMFVEVQGAYTYDTQIGGSTTVPSLLVNMIDTTNLSPQASQRSFPPSVASDPALLPTSESASGSPLRSLAADAHPLVLPRPADR